MAPVRSLPMAHIFFRARPSGNMQLARARARPDGGEIRLARATPIASDAEPRGTEGGHRPPAVSRPMPLDSQTCSAMFGNGVRIVGMRPMRERRRMAAPG